MSNMIRIAVEHDDPQFTQVFVTDKSIKFFSPTSILEWLETHSKGYHHYQYYSLRVKIIYV